MTNTLQLAFPTNEKKSKLIVESGHIYTNEQPNLEHQVGATLGNMLSRYLALFGPEIEKWLFIDNYNPKFEEKPQDLDIVAYISLLPSWGFAPDKIVYEADLVNNAKEIVDHLQKHGDAGPHHNGRIILNKGKILLYDPGNGKYMCALLDACLYMHKLEHADGCVTILDQQYAAQQKGTFTILKKLGVDTTTIFPFFYTTPNSQPHSSVDSFNVFANGKNNLSFVQPAIDLLQIVAKLSGSVYLGPSLKVEVRKYGV